MPSQYDFKIPGKRVGLSRKRGRTTDDEPVETKKSKAEVLEPVRLPKENETKEKVKKSKNGKRFSDQDEALKFVKENRKENLFVRSDVGKNAFLVRACYELAAAGQNVLFIYDEHARFRIDSKNQERKRSKKETRKKWAYAFDEQAQEDPVKKAMVCENLEDMKEDFEGVQKAIQGKKIVMGSLHQKWFEELVSQLIEDDIFVPDTVILSGLEHTKPESFLKIRETWDTRVIGSYNLDVERDRASAAEYVSGSGETLNRLFLVPRDSDNFNENPFADLGSI